MVGNYSAGPGYSGDGDSATGAQFYLPAYLALGRRRKFVHCRCRQQRHSEGGLRHEHDQYGRGHGRLGVHWRWRSGNGGNLQRRADLKVDSSGNLLIADGGNNAIREIDKSTGWISMVVGSGAWGYSGDGGPATSAN